LIENIIISSAYFGIFSQFLEFGMTKTLEFLELIGIPRHPWYACSVATFFDPCHVLASCSALLIIENREKEGENREPVWGMDEE
jgi:hypothetical protein